MRAAGQCKPRKGDADDQCPGASLGLIHQKRVNYFSFVLGEDPDEIVSKYRNFAPSGSFHLREWPLVLRLSYGWVHYTS